MTDDAHATRPAGVDGLELWGWPEKRPTSWVLTHPPSGMALSWTRTTSGEIVSGGIRGLRRAQRAVREALEGVTGGRWGVDWSWPIEKIRGHRRGMTRLYNLNGWVEMGAKDHDEQRDRVRLVSAILKGEA